MLRIFYFKKKYREKGFTLLEALVVIFIIGLMSALILASYQSNKKRYALIQASQKLISDIRKVQNMAMSGTETQGFCSGASLCYGYGISFNFVSPSSYIIFADKNNNQAYDSEGGEGLETINLPFPIIIQSVYPPSPVNVFFMPPDPITYINGDNGANVSAEIVLKIQGTVLTKTISVSTAGLIENN